MERDEPSVVESLIIVTGWLTRQPGGEGIAARLVELPQGPGRKVIQSSDEEIEVHHRSITRFPQSGIGRARSAGDSSDGTAGEPDRENADMRSHDEVVGEIPFPGNGISVRDAGLILLHPFIGRLFRHFGWLDVSGGIDPEWRWHAVQALQYLALGRCGLPEPTLVLEKTLCGIPLHDPAAFPTLEDAVLAECEDLLAAVIGHWAILGKTSPNGLRESFLIRDGLLDFGENDIRLAVERRSYDMLLAHLPWPLGPVSFKWLDRVIHVHWSGESRT